MTTRPLSQEIVLLLNALGRGPKGGTLEIHARTEGGVGYRHQTLATPPGVPWAYLPPSLLELIEERWVIYVGAAVRGPAGSGLVSLAVLFATWPIRVDFSRDTRWRHEPVGGDVDAARARLEQFPLVPAFLIDAFESLTAIWPLDAPLRDMEYAARTQRALAERLDASMAPTTLLVPGGRNLTFTTDAPGALVLLPGSPVRSRGTPPPIVTFAQASPEPVYTLEQFEAVLGQEEHTR